jgi:hypothetical protein
MPTIVEKGRIRFCIYPREHIFEPPHVHVWVGNDDVCRIDLNSGEFMEDPPPGERSKILKLYIDNAVIIRQKWDQIHGR